MDLKNFVKDTITQLIEGIKEAQDNLKGSGAIVSPNDIRTVDASSQPLIFMYEKDKTNKDRTYTRNVSLLEFDVAIVVEQEKSGGGKLGVNVLSMGIEGGGKAKQSDSKTNRSKFNIPIALPVASVD